MAIRAVPCDLNGQTLRLRLDLGAMAALEDHGISLDGIMERLADKDKPFSPRSVRFMLWAMLQGEDPAPSLKDVGRWVDGDNFYYVVKQIGQALQLAFPEAANRSDPLAGAGIGEPPSASPTAPSP